MDTNNQNTNTQTRSAPTPGMINVMIETYLEVSPEANSDFQKELLGCIERAVDQYDAAHPH